MSRIGEEAAFVSAAADGVAAAAQQGLITHVRPPEPPDVSAGPTGDCAEQQVSEQSNRQKPSDRQVLASAVPSGGDDATAPDIVEREKGDRCAACSS